MAKWEVQDVNNRGNLRWAKDRTFEANPVQEKKKGAYYLCCAKGSNLTKKLMESRREDIELEEAKWKK